eukprot:gene23820-9983_t
MPIIQKHNETRTPPLFLVALENIALTPTQDTSSQAPGAQECFDMTSPASRGQKQERQKLNLSNLNEHDLDPYLTSYTNRNNTSVLRCNLCRTIWCGNLTDFKECDNLKKVQDGPPDLTPNAMSSEPSTRRRGNGPVGGGEVQNNLSHLVQSTDVPKCVPETPQSLDRTCLDRTCLSRIRPLRILMTVGTSPYPPGPPPV